MRRAFAGQAGVVVLGTGLAYVAAFGVSKTVAVKYGPAGVGMVGALLGFGALCASLILVGQLNNVPVWVANFPERRRQLTILSNRAVVVTGIPFLAASTLAIAYLLTYRGPWWSLAIGYVSITVALLLGLQRPALLSALATSRSVAGYVAIASSLMAAVSVPMIALTSEELVPISLGLGMLAGQAGASLAFRRRLAVSRPAPNWGLVIAYLRSGLGAFAGTSANALVMGGLPVVVLALVGASEAGLFRAAWTIAAVIWAFAYAALKNTYLPQVSQRLASGVDTHEFHAASVGQVLAITGVATTVTVLLAPVGLNLLFSSEFLGASDALAILALGSIARVWITVNGFFLLALGSQRVFSVVEGVTMLLVLLGALSGSVGGVTCLALGISVAFFVGATLSEIAVWRISSSRPTPCLSAPSWAWLSMAAAVACTVGVVII